MAPSVSWMHSFVAVLLAQLAVVFAVDSERFPLSGGVANGVNVQFKISSLDQDVTIDFLNASRSCVFRFHVDVTNKQIVRTDESGEDETWGGWPWAAEALTDVVFDFHKTKFHWQVSIGSVRMPYFDFAHRSEDLVVHALVTTDADKLVIQTRPKCEKVCHFSECVSDVGDSCPAGGCFSRRPLASNGHAECTASDNSGSHVDAECCTGHPLAVDFESVEAGTWFNVLASDTDDTRAYVQRVCAAFNVNCDGLGGTNVRAVTQEAAAHTLQVYSPVREVDGQASTVSIPSYLLSLKPAVKAIFNMTRPQMKKVLVQGDDTPGTPGENDGLIAGLTDSDVAMPDGFYGKYWYINMMTASFEAYERSRWFAYFDDRWDYERDVKGDDSFVYQVLLTDYDAPTTTCVDDEFTDNNGHTCADYNAGEWCDEHGRALNDFCAASNLADGCNLYQVVPSGSISAPWACCKCGGGFHESPVETTQAENVLWA